LGKKKRKEKKSVASASGVSRVTLTRDLIVDAL
jgi:hypothetical protein